MAIKPPLEDILVIGAGAFTGSGVCCGLVELGEHGGAEVGGEAVVGEFEKGLGGDPGVGSGYEVGGG